MCRGRPADRLDWLDFLVTDGNENYASVGPEPPLIRNHKPSNFPRLPDQEYQGVDFLGHRDIVRLFDNAQETRDAWVNDFWASKGKTPNWDAIGVCHQDDRGSVLLVEAKAHTGELAGGGSGAKDRDSIFRIDRALGRARDWVGASQEAKPWRTCKYYQYANRVTSLGFLRGDLEGHHDRKLDTKLLFIYMCGDKHPGLRRGDALKGDFCPVSRAGWKLAIEAMYAELGIASIDKKELGIHDLFIDVVKVEEC